MTHRELTSEQLRYAINGPVRRLFRTVLQFMEHVGCNSVTLHDEAATARAGLNKEQFLHARQWLNKNGMLKITVKDSGRARYERISAETKLILPT